MTRSVKRAASTALVGPAGYRQAFRGICNAIRELFTPQILLVLLVFLTLLPFYIAYSLVGRKPTWAGRVAHSQLPVPGRARA